MISFFWEKLGTHSNYQALEPLLGGTILLKNKKNKLKINQVAEKNRTNLTINWTLPRDLTWKLPISLRRHILSQQQPRKTKNKSFYLLKLPHCQKKHTYPTPQEFSVTKLREIKPVDVHKCLLKPTTAEKIRHLVVVGECYSKGKLSIQRSEFFSIFSRLFERRADSPAESLLDFLLQKFSATTIKFFTGTWLQTRYWLFFTFFKTIKNTFLLSNSKNLSFLRKKMVSLISGLFFDSKFSVKNVKETSR